MVVCTVVDVVPKLTRLLPRSQRPSIDFLVREIGPGSRTWCAHGWKEGAGVGGEER